MRPAFYRAAILLVGLPSLASAQTGLLPEPKGNEQNNALAWLHLRYKDKFDKAIQDRVVRRALAEKLLQEGQQMGRGAAACYVYLGQARDLAISAADVTLALRAVEELARRYAVDADVMRMQTIARSAEAVRSFETGKAVADASLALADDAVDQDRYEQALRLAALAEKAARRSKDLPLVLAVQRHERGIRAAQQQFSRFKSFEERLGKDPEDPEANRKVGRFLVLRKGQWQRGLFLLAQSNDLALRLLAQRDLARPETIHELVELGDAWWRQADKEKDLAKTYLQQRAVHWYERAAAISEMDYYCPMHPQIVRQNPDKCPICGMPLSVRKKGVDEATRARLDERIASVPRPRPRLAGPDYSGPARPLLVFRGHGNTVFRAAFSPDGKKVLSGDSRGVGILWDAATGKQQLLLRGHSGLIWSVAYDSRGRYLFTGSWDGTVKMWDARTGQEMRRFPMQGRIPGINGIAISPDGKRLIAGSDDAAVHVWDIEGGPEVSRLLGHKTMVYGVAFTPDGKYAVSGSNDNTLIVWDVQAGRLVRRIAGARGKVLSVAVSRDGRTVLCAGDSDAVQWDLKTGREVRRFKGQTQPVTAVAFSPDGRRILSGGMDGSVRLWDTATGRELHRFIGHTSAVFSVAFSPGGYRAVSAGQDGTVRLWGLPR
jgi:WD40 repeat protein